MVSYPDDFWWECQGFKLQARCPNKTDLRFPLFNKNQWLINGASEWARLLTQWRKGWFRPPATKDKLETHSNRCFWILDVAIKLNTCQKRVFRTPILVKRVAYLFWLISSHISLYHEIHNLSSMNSYLFQSLFEFQMGHAFILWSKLLFLSIVSCKTLPIWLLQFCGISNK